MKVPIVAVPEGPGEDHLALEEPLEIRVEGQTVAVTMRSPGQDLDLTAGFLWSEGVVDGPDDLRALAEVGPNTVDVRLAEGVPAARARSADRNLFASSSCGICGTASVARLARVAPPLLAWRPSAALLLGLPTQFEREQAEYGTTGGMHAAALFDGDGRVFLLREDVGRHNAVDKVLGAALREERDLRGLGLVVSSRAGFELVQKAWMTGLSALVAFGAPTSLAVSTAQQAGLCLVGWLKPGRCVYFT